MVELEEPDQGRAWVVAIAACIINMILSGISRMIGILYVAVLDEYHVTRQEATLPFTVRNSIRMLSGPIVGVIGQSFGIRPVTILGGVIASAGAALCCIAPNITWLAILWGGVHGLGFALANTLFQVVVNQYFHKYRATASGIALSGACIGSLGFPFMIEAILNTYGLSGGFLILAGVIMHVLPPSFLLSAPQWIEHPRAYARLKRLQISAGKSTDSVATANTVLDCDSPKSTSESPVRLSRSTSMDNPGEQVSFQVIHNNLSEERNMQGGRQVKHNDPPVVCTLYKIQESPNLANNKDHQNEDGGVPNNSSDPVAPPGNEQNANPNSSSSPPTENSASKNGSPKPPPEARSTPADNPGNTTSIKESLKSMIGLFKNPVYVLISVCMSTYIIVFIPILTVLVDYSKDKGIPESYGKYLINAMAIGDLAGRLCFGWITDRGYMSIPAFFTLNLVLQGVFIALFPLAMTLLSFMALLALYGVTAGSMLVLFPILVLKYVELRAQSVAMACVGFLAGIMSFAIPPMIGHFRDVVGSYDDMFYVVGGVSVLSGGLWLFEPIVAKRFHKMYENKDNSIENILNNQRQQS